MLYMSRAKNDSYVWVWPIKLPILYQLKNTNIYKLGLLGGIYMQGWITQSRHIRLVNWRSGVKIFFIFCLKEVKERIFIDMIYSLL